MLQNNKVIKALTEYCVALKWADSGEKDREAIWLLAGDSESESDSERYGRPEPENYQIRYRETLDEALVELHPGVLAGWITTIWEDIFENGQEITKYCEFVDRSKISSPIPPTPQYAPIWGNLADNGQKTEKAAPCNHQGNFIVELSKMSVLLNEVFSDIGMIDGIVHILGIDQDELISKGAKIVARIYCSILDHNHVEQGYCKEAESSACRNDLLFRWAVQTALVCLPNGTESVEKDHTDWISGLIEASKELTGANGDFDQHVRLSDVEEKLIWEMPIDFPLVFTKASSLIGQLKKKQFPALNTEPKLPKFEDAELIKCLKNCWETPTFSNRVQLILRLWARSLTLLPDAFLMFKKIDSV